MKYTKIENDSFFIFDFEEEFKGLIVIDKALDDNKMYDTLDTFCKIVTKDGEYVHRTFLNKELFVNDEEAALEMIAINCIDSYKNKTIVKRTPTNALYPWNEGFGSKYNQKSNPEQGPNKSGGDQGV